MKIEIDETVLIVTGSELVPEEKDRPLAYRLKDEIDKRGTNQYRRAIVVSDRWYLENELLHLCPTVLIGGPGVNKAMAELYNKIPVVSTVDDKAFIQLSDGESNVQAAVWGMNCAATEEALDQFMEKVFLDKFLHYAWNQ